MEIFLSFLKYSWSWFWKMGWNDFIFKFVVFLTVQIPLEEKADLIFLRHPLRLTAATGCILYGDPLTVSWSIYLQAYQSSDIYQFQYAPASLQCNLLLLSFGSVVANKDEGNTSNPFRVPLLLSGKLLAERRDPAGSFC